MGTADMTANNWPKVFFPLFLQSKVSEFLQLVSSTLQSDLATYSDSGMPDEGSEEAQFVLALCGIVTSEEQLNLEYR